eukprot:SAG31_NODE_4985_length_2818_cov_4.900735_3_plen_259_part_00
MLYIELPLHLTELVSDQRHWTDGVPPKWKVPEIATRGNTNPRTWVAARMQGALWITVDQKKTLGYKIRQADGSAIVKALRLEHSIVAAMPPALALPVQHLEMHWRIVIMMLGARDPAQQFGLASRDAAADMLQDSMDEIIFWAKRIFVQIEYSMKRSGQKRISSYFTPSMEALVRHAVEDMRALPNGESLAMFSTSAFEMMHVLTRIVGRDRTGKRGKLKNSEDPMKALVLKHSMWRWSRISSNPQLLQRHEASWGCT